MGGLWTFPKGTVKNDRKKRVLCTECKNLSLWNYYRGMRYLWQIFGDPQTEKNLKNTDIPHLCKEQINFKVPYCHVVNDLTVGPAGLRLP